MKANILTRVVQMLVFAQLIWIGSPAFGQGGGGRGMGPGWGGDPEERLERHVTFLEQQLELSDDQVNQLKEILAARHEEARRWMDENEDATREERRAFMKSHREGTDEAIGAILTPEQKEQYKEISDRMGRRADRMGQRRDDFFDELNLTEDQRKKLDELRESHRAAMRAWMDQHPDATTEERQGFMDELHKSGRAAMEGFLTPEQIQKIDEHHKSMRGGMMGMMGTRGPGRGAGGPGYGPRRMAERLDLTDEQIDQIAELREQQCMSFRSGLESILTPEQVAELREARKHRGGRRAGWMGSCWD